MRKLMWFTLGFSTACGFCAYLRPENWIMPLIIVVAAGVLFGLGKKELDPLELLCFGCGVGLCWFALFQQYYLSPALSADGEVAALTVNVTDYSYETNYGVAVDGKTELNGKTYQIRVYLNETRYLEPGDSISGAFRLRYTPGGADAATFHPGKGIFLLGYQRGDVEMVKAGVGDVLRYPAVLAKWIKVRLRLLFPGDVFPFTQALLLGYGSALDYATDTAFKLSGIRHIIAVSGLHVTILYSLISSVTFKKRYLTAILTLPTLLLFAAVAGFTPSVTRACIMVGLMVLAQICNRQYDSPTALSFAVLVMLLANPLVITAAGFQLTVGCVAGIQLYNTPINQWISDRLGGTKGNGILPLVKRWFASSVSVTLSAMSLTTPLCAYYFGTVSLVGVLTNLLTLWLVTLIFNGIVVALLLSLISLKAAAFLAGILALPIRFVVAAAKFLGGLPLAAVYTASGYIVIWLVFLYVLLAVFMFGRKKRPLLLTACAALGLCAALAASWIEPKLDDCHMTMLDVGQGQSILLQSRAERYLIDCGGDSDTMAADTIVQALRSQGIFHLDGIILTHGDRDHAGALPYILAQIQVERIYLPSTVTDLPEVNCETIRVSEDRVITFGAGELRIFPPVFGENDNENSLCVLFAADNCDILITGDRSSLGEMLLVQENDLPQVDLLVAGHHGSKYSTSELLLDTVQPEIVFISAGADNSYGHPAPELLARLQRYGCRVYRTDLHGNLVFRR